MAFDPISNITGIASGLIGGLGGFFGFNQAGVIRDRRNQSLQKSKKLYEYKLQSQQVSNKTSVDQFASDLARSGVNVNAGTTQFAFATKASTAATALSLENEAQNIQFDKEQLDIDQQYQANSTRGIFDIVGGATKMANNAFSLSLGSS